MDILFSLLAALKAFLPAIFGSLIAVWKRGSSSSTKLKDLALSEKLVLAVLIVFAFIISVFLGKWLGGAITLQFGFNSTWGVVVEFITAISSLKVIDGVLSSADGIVKVVVEKAPQVAVAFFDGLIDKIKKIFE